MVLDAGWKGVGLRLFRPPPRTFEPGEEVQVVLDPRGIALAADGAVRWCRDRALGLSLAWREGEPPERWKSRLLREAVTELFGWLRKGAGAA